jgi:integrase
MRGHIRERSPNHWAIVIDVRDPATGRRKRKWHSFRGTKREAQIECARLIIEREGGAYIDPKRMTVAAYLDRWLGHMRTQISARSCELYGESIANIVPHIGHVILSKLQPASIAAMYATALERGGQRGEGLAPSSIKMMHRLLVQAFRQAVKWQLIARNPVDAVSAPRVERRQMRVLDTDGAAAYLAAARGHELCVPIMLGILCGLRRGEIAAVRWQDVDLDAGRLAVTGSIEQTAAGVRRKAPKSGRSRVIALPALAIEELRRHRQHRRKHCCGSGCANLMTRRYACELTFNDGRRSTCRTALSTSSKLPAYRAFVFMTCATATPHTYSWPVFILRSHRNGLAIQASC